MKDIEPITPGDNFISKKSAFQFSSEELSVLDAWKDSAHSKNAEVPAIQVNYVPAQDLHAFPAWLVDTMQCLFYVSYSLIDINRILQFCKEYFDNPFNDRLPINDALFTSMELKLHLQGSFGLNHSSLLVPAKFTVNIPWIYSLHSIYQNEIVLLRNSTISF